MDDKLEDGRLLGHTKKKSVNPKEFSRIVDGYGYVWKLCPHSHPSSIEVVSSKMAGPMEEEKLLWIP
jgi:hypothetical protein